MDSGWRVVITIPGYELFHRKEAVATDRTADDIYREQCEELRMEIARHCDIPNLGWSAKAKDQIAIEHVEDADE